MRSVGVVVEYNPFHNGHKFHLEQTKQATNAEVIIAVMSGNFLQRGEPALVSKWARTKMALENGIDIVVELPYQYATQKADIFANGAISILSSLFCNFICFGSENGSINEFNDTVLLMKENEQVYNSYLKKELKKGISYPKAASIAYSLLNHGSSFIDLTKPNNTLGFHYVKAIRDQGSTMIPYTIKRTSANYHDEHFTSSTIASATSIRKALFDNTGNLSKIESYIPQQTKKLLIDYKERYGIFHQWEDYFPFLKYKIITHTPLDLKKYYEIEEGLEYRFYNKMRESTTFKEFIEKVKTKRYTWTRLQRASLRILTNTKKSEMTEGDNFIHPTYIRLLGMTGKGQQYIRTIKKDIDIPLVSTLSSIKEEDHNLDLRATAAYSMVLKEPIRSRFIKEEFSTPPIRFDEKNRIYI